MKLRLITLLAVVVWGVGSWGQTAGPAPDVTIKNGSVTPVAASCLPNLRGSGNAVALLSDPDQASLSKLLGISTQQCSDGNLKCGSTCCGSGEQCCFNSATGGHYCAKKCSN